MIKGVFSLEIRFIPELSQEEIPPTSTLPNNLDFQELSMQVKVSDTGKLSHQAQPGVSVTMTSALPLVGKLWAGSLDPFGFPSSLPPSMRSWK